MEGGPTTFTSEKDCGALGGLFQTIINDMRGSSPIWEDFASKALKLHTSLKATVVAIGAFLEAFQKVADMATGSKGATKEIGSALTRLCLRHRSIEAHLKVFTSSIVDNLVSPLQEKLEDWKKTVAQIDKDHAKEHKKAKQDIKKAASDTMRLQKKVRKGGGSQHGHHKSHEMQAKLDVSMHEVNAKYNVLEDTMKSSVRTALIEERGRFCHFITCLKPFVDGELKLLTEISNIGEIMHSLCLQASEPSVLPASSEQVILDLKGLDNSAWNFNQQPSPPSSPSSLGSRKSSMCSINSINSSSSGSSKSHSPSHTMHKRTPSQTSSTNAESQAEGDCDSTPTTPSDNTPSACSTWNNWPNPPGGNNKMDPSRPHTISSAYEKGHGRPALKPDMFEPPPAGVEMRPKPSRSNSQSHGSTSSVSSISSNSSNSSHRPSASISKMQPVLPPHCPKAKVKAVPPPIVPTAVQQPIYANTAQISQTSPDDGEPTTPTTPAGMTQIQADTSLELAKAIRELEASTAALTSAYDHDGPPSSGPANNTATSNVPVGGSGGDSDSYTSKSSLPCSSGYGTMTSTPAGSEDTIASGGSQIATTTVCKAGDSSPLEEEGEEMEDGEAIPSSSSLTRRSSSASNSKPPPPVRRTASVKSAVLPQQKMRQSPQRQMSEGSQPTDSVVRHEDGPYAELQLIQQKIQQQQPSLAGYRGPESMGHPQQQQQHYHQHHSDDSGQSQTTTVLQSLNAKFASLNNQYRDGTNTPQQLGGNGVTGPAVGQPKPTSNGPPTVKQKPKMAVPPPPSITMAEGSGGVHHHHHQLQQQQQHQHHSHTSSSNSYHQGNGSGPEYKHTQPQQTFQQSNQSQHHPYYPQQQQHTQQNRNLQQQHYQQQPPHQHHPQSHQQQQQQQHRHHHREEDFPLPPTVEELQEMERIYSCPHPPTTSAIGQHPAPSTKPPQPLATHQARPPHQSSPAIPQADVSQHSLMQELKRRVSVDTDASSSDA